MYMNIALIYNYISLSYTFYYITIYFYVLFYIFLGQVLER